MEGYNGGIFTKGDDHMRTAENTLTLCAQQILSQVRRAVVGKDTALLWVLATILAGGHILLEDIPGVGKTTMALAFSRVLDLPCRRMQFTPDVLPSDVTGYCVPEKEGLGLHYRPGAVMCCLFLADELNRGTSRAQSALLEAMEEGQVTVDGITHPLPQPFVVIATQNPTGAAGTSLLPDSQLDRFTIRISLGYPSPQDELNMVLRRQEADPLSALEPVISRQQLCLLRREVTDTFVSDSVAHYIVDLIAATRNHPRLLRGASPRATVALTAMSKSVARLRGRDYTVPGDVREVFQLTVAHRLVAAPGESPSQAPAQLLREILESTPAPRLR